MNAFVFNSRDLETRINELIERGTPLNEFRIGGVKYTRYSLYDFYAVLTWCISNETILDLTAYYHEHPQEWNQHSQGMSLI